VAKKGTFIVVKKVRDTFWKSQEKYILVRRKVAWVGLEKDPSVRGQSSEEA